jgi:hypothetical protein
LLSPKPIKYSIVELGSSPAKLSLASRGEVQTQTSDVSSFATPLRPLATASLRQAMEPSYVTTLTSPIAKHSHT